MDDIVKAALVKWPNVPNCFGWLGLDARGNWYMRDEQAQAAGPFGGAPGNDPARHAAAKGSLLRHDKLIDFIQRNYEPDGGGQWFFQNGPQRVYIELEATPFIWRLNAGADSSTKVVVTAHSGQSATVRQCLLDEHGRLYLEADLGIGLVHTLDMLAAADAIEHGLWTPEVVKANDLPHRYGYVTSPEALQNK